MLNEAGNRPPVLTPDQSHLKLVDTRIRGLNVNDPGSSELARLEAARADIVGRMSRDELTAYDKLVSLTKTKEQLRAEAEVERLAMEANKDRPPI